MRWLRPRGVPLAGTRRNYRSRLPAEEVARIVRKPTGLRAPGRVVGMSHAAAQRVSTGGAGGWLTFHRDTEDTTARG